MPQLKAVKLRYEHLVKYTDNFSESNYIGSFQFGKFYRGKTKFCRWTRYMMVKIWEAPEIYKSEHDLRLMEELVLLRHEMLINHPGMLELYGYCCNDGFLGVVYEFKAFDSVFNLIPKGLAIRYMIHVEASSSLCSESYKRTKFLDLDQEPAWHVHFNSPLARYFPCFTWLQRIKAALGLASLLRFMHAGRSSGYKPFVVHNLAATHVVLDEDYNPKLCDFGSISGGILNSGYWSIKQDVFAFGVILLSLISKRVYLDKDIEGGLLPSVYEWALTEYEAFESESETKNTVFSLVHKSLAAEDEFCQADGHKISMLALQCVNRIEHERPTMKQVVRSLLKLEVAKQHPDFLEAKKVPYTRETPC